MCRLNFEARHNKYTGCEEARHISAGEFFVMHLATVLCKPNLQGI